MPSASLLSETRILIVEDDAVIRGTLTDLLRDEGCKVTAAPHGRDALAQLRKSAPPDVIVLDLMMPVMDGWEFRVEQKNDPLLAGIPVIAMSADISAKARAIAADAYLRKPIDFDELAHRIRSVVDQCSKQRLAAADRMAALGTLASGIAHEINNPLTYVMANLQLLQDRLTPLGGPQGVELRELAAETAEGVERIRRIVKHAQMVAPVQPETRETVVDVRQALDAALELLAGEIRQRARLVPHLAGQAHVRGDRGRVEQLLVNLLLNALQSIPEGRVAQNEIRVSLRALASEQVLVEISDTGCGIPAEVQERIFQPFFTTKPIGQGTGLGLSICHGIVSALGGQISFESEIDRGTVFRVVLPAVPGQTEASDPGAARPASQPAPSRKPRVLVVDNETSILRVTRQMLEPAYEVATAIDAESAVAMVKAGRTFDVILCELMLPGTTGLDLRQMLEQTTPPLADRLIFMTAGAFTPRARRLLENTNRPWLRKPFDRDELCAIVGTTTSGDS